VYIGVSGMPFLPARSTGSVSYMPSGYVSFPARDAREVIR
jgi:hypothetical protein